MTCNGSTDGGPERAEAVGLDALQREARKKQTRQDVYGPASHPADGA